MACSRSVAFKAVELVLSAVCLVFKRVTDDEARRQRLSDLRLDREWPLYRAVAISIDGSVATNVVFGAYVLVSLALLVGHLTGELGPQRWRMETFLLVVGAGGFVVAASMAYVTLDSVVPSLLDNAAVLGTLGLLTGLVFLADALLLLSARRAKPPVQDPQPAKEPPRPLPAARHDKVTQTPAGEAYSRVYTGGPLKSSLRSPRRVQFPAPGAEATAARPPSPPPPPSSSSDDGSPSPSPPQRERDDSPPASRGRSRSRSQSPGPAASSPGGALRLPALGPAVPLQQRQRTLQVVGDPLEVRSSEDSALLDSLRALHAMDIPPPPREHHRSSPPRDTRAVGGEKDRELAEEVQESNARAQHHRQLQQQQQQQQLQQQQREESPLSARELQLLNSGREDPLQLDSSRERDLLQVLAPLSPAERERLLLDSLRGSGKFRWGRRSNGQVSPPPHWGYDARVANRAHRDRESPSSPLDPGYVRHAASNWPVTPPSGSRTPRTPSQSPSGSESSGSPPVAGQTPGAAPGAAQRSGSGGGGSSRAPRRHDSDEDDDDDVPAGGSLTTQLLQRWLRSRHARVGKAASQP